MACAQVWLWWPIPSARFQAAHLQREDLSKETTEYHTVPTIQVGFDPVKMCFKTCEVCMDDVEADKVEFRNCAGFRN